MGQEKAILIGVQTANQVYTDVEEHLDELGLLVDTLGFKIAESHILPRKRLEAASFIGKGQADEIGIIAEELDVQNIIFDDDLSPTQSSNLEKITKARIMDRSQVILDIFANHARTREAKTQIELAQMEYLLPRLKRRWTHLERQSNVVGVRGGMGETQIEIDRRLVRTKIAKLKKDLEAISREKDTQRKRRSEVFKVALVGYTNAGKSTLMNALTDAEVLVEDKLFATLDTTVRQFILDKNHKVLLSDTVGFIRKLPHNLVASFQSTLAEVQNADLILKVADVGSIHALKHLEVVDETLKELNAHHTPSLVVFNKIDTMDERVLKRAQQKYPDCVLISAAKQLRIQSLKDAILDELRKNEARVRLTADLSKVKIIAGFRNHAIVLSEKYDENSIILELLCHKPVWNHLLKKYKGEFQYKIL